MSLTFSYRHLYYFWVVAKEGGMSRAAARLDMAVQTVSAQVRELERARSPRRAAKGATAQGNAVDHFVTLRMKGATVSLAVLQLTS